MTDPLRQPEVSAEERQFIADAAAYLETPTFLMRLADLAGKPVAILMKGIDWAVPDVLDSIVGSALRSALSVAVYTLPAAAKASEPAADDSNATSIDWWSKASVMLTGTAGGLFGMPGLAAELPLTTTLMLRSIAATGQALGEDIKSPEVQLECLSVFAFGGPSEADDALESTYLTARVGLQQYLSHAAKIVAAKTADELAVMLQKGSAPAVLTFIAKIAAQFDIAVSQKILAQAVPVVGALGGAVVNVAFVDHFNRIARFHFGIRRLERRYGPERIQEMYRSAVRTLKAKQGGTLQAH